MMLGLSDNVAIVMKATFATAPDALAELGVTSKSRVALTLEGKAAAAAKSAATRAARHTMGPRQKAGVKGDVTGVVVTPIRAVPPVVAAPNGATAPETSAGVLSRPTVVVRFHRSRSASPGDREERAFSRSTKLEASPRPRRRRR